MKSIELFTGAGGLALGTHQAGFHHLAVVEWDHDSCDTLRLNGARRADTGVDWRVIEGDARDVNYAEFPSDIDLLAGGAPCQPFSLGGKHAGEADRRNMFPEVFRAVRELRPRAFLLENVNGLTRAPFASYLDYVLLQLRFPDILQSTTGTWEEHKVVLAAYHEAATSANCPCWYRSAFCRYDVKFCVIDAADFGVPQRRQRVFIVGFRRDLGIQWQFPEPTHSQDALRFSQYVDGSYWEEHELPAPPIPVGLANHVARIAAKPKPMERRWRTVRDAISGLPVPVDHDPNPPLDSHIGIPGARTYPGHDGSHWDSPAKALKAGGHGNPGGENMLRGDDGSVRYFTTREMARLQTFPDEWWFAGPRSASRRQLGNAVPVTMAEMLARLVREELERVGHVAAANRCSRGQLRQVDVPEPTTSWRSP